MKKLGLLSLSFIVFLGLVGCVPTAVSDLPISPTVGGTAVPTEIPTLIPITSTSTAAPQNPTNTPASMIMHFSPTPTAVPQESPDAPILFFVASDGHLYRTGVMGNLWQQLTITPESLDGNSDVWRSYIFYRPPQISPDGKWLILNDGRGGWTVLELSSGQLTSQGKGDDLLCPTWSPDSQHFAYLDQNNRLCIFSLADQTTTCPFTGLNRIIGAKWSPNDSQIAVAVSDPECCTGELWLLDSSDSSAEMVATFSTTFESNIDKIVAWVSAPSGLLIKAHASGPAAFYWPQDGTLQTLSQPVLDASPNGRFLLFPSGEIGENEGTIPYSPPNLCEAGALALLHDWAWSPDGKQLSYLTSCQAEHPVPTYLSVIDLAAGSLLWQVQVAQPLQLIHWSPDATYLFLDQADILPGDSPIWRILADGSGALEIALSEGFLLGIVPQRNELH